MPRRRWTLKRLACTACTALVTELVEDDADLPRCLCGGTLTKPDPIAPQSPTVHGDELWGGPRYVENLASTPIFVSTKSEYRALLKAHGMEMKVRHVPVPGTDKSPHTTRWALPLPPGVDARPFAMLSPDEQQARRIEAAERFGMTVAELEAISTNLESARYAGDDRTPCAEFYPD